jgi:polar amino acid transport system substrate-binding protein
MGKVYYRSVKARVMLVGLTTLLTCIPVHGESAGTDSPRPLNGEPLQMRTLENPPLAYTDENGDVIGILVEGIREAVRRTGHEVEFRIEPWKRVLKEVATGNADGAFNAGKNEERETWGLYHNSVLMDETYVFFAREPRALSRNLKEAPELRVGIQLGYYYGERFDLLLQNPPFRALEVAQTIPRSLELLRADRTDVFIGDLLPTLYYLKELGLEDEIHIVREKESGLPLVVSTSPTYVAFSRRRIDPEYVQAFDEALESMKADLTFDAILGNYHMDVPELPDTL